MKGEISNFKPPEYLNGILIKDNINIKAEQEEEDGLMSTVNYPVRTVERIDRLILNN